MLAITPADESDADPLRTREARPFQKWAGTEESGIK